MFGKKEQATQNDVMGLMGSKKTVEQPQTDRVQDYNNQVLTDKKVQSLIAEIQSYPKAVLEGALALFANLKKSSDENANIAPPGFFQKLSDQGAEATVVTTYLFKHWHTAVIDKGANDIPELLDSYAKLNDYIKAQSQPEILREFAGYYLRGMAVTYTGFLTQQAPDSKEAVQQKLKGIEKMCRKILLIKDTAATPQQPQQAAKATSTQSKDFAAAVQAYGMTIEQIMQDMGEKEAQAFYAQDKAGFLKVANYVYPSFIALKDAMQAEQEAELDIDVKVILAILKESKSFNPANAADNAEAVVNVVFAVFMQKDTASLKAQERLALLPLGSATCKQVKSSILDILKGGLKDKLDSSGLPWFKNINSTNTQFVALQSAANESYNIDKERGFALWSEHGKHFDKVGNTDFSKAMLYAATGVLNELRSSGADKGAYALEGFVVVAQWISMQPNKQAYFDLLNLPFHIIKGNSNEQKNSEFNETLEQVIGFIQQELGDKDRSDLLNRAMAEFDKASASTGLTWFDTCGIQAVEFIALKAGANKLYAADLKQDSQLFKRFRGQISDVADTDFGKAMFYAGFSILDIAKNYGTKGTEAVAPVLVGFHKVCDWIATQDEAEQYFEFMNIPASIIGQIDESIRTPKFNEAYQSFIQYAQVKFDEFNNSRATNKSDSIENMLAAMDKLTEGLAQMPGIDPADIERLRDIGRKR
ncbi:MAG: hypothetical protein GY734_21980 [Herbaspirillum sp.]|uniref:hypothetical protein n=1 Tax=Herbaspirillum sp. TaxID=1890675 RepID=UPI00258A68AE|nr:hypothetical protein [Herbaspirillum sp.]MCP3658537.1 hypothetical protein [Herbaspirillum sp.]MCP4033890.1 hypothetical protein [Herbaspirillum sp.]